MYAKERLLQQQKTTSGEILSLMNLDFLLQHSDSRVRIWHKQHESTAPPSLESVVQAASGGGYIVDAC